MVVKYPNFEKIFQFAPEYTCCILRCFVCIVITGLVCIVVVFLCVL
jgi:hypothetical protein